MNSENWVVSTIYQKLLIIFNYLFSLLSRLEIFRSE